MDEQAQDHRGPGVNAFRYRAFGVVAGILVVASSINIVWAVASPPHRSAVRPHADERLSTLVAEEQPTMSATKGFTAYLRDLARDGSFVVAEREDFDVVWLENFSQVTVVAGSYDPEVDANWIATLDPGVVVEDYGVIGHIVKDMSIEANSVKYSFLLLDDTLAPSLTHYRVGNKVYFVDDRLGTP